VERSRKQLQDLTGQPVLGFRAPEFSVPSLDHWSFAVLAEAGFAYDSSVFPIAGARYGLPGAPAHPFPIQTASGRIQEFPLATWALGKRRVPVAGGTYFRLWPGVILRRALAEIDRGGGTAVLYVHPYEFSADRLFLTGLTWRQRLDPAYLKYAILHNLFTGAILRRLAPILRQYEFRPLEEICGAISHQPLAVGHQMPPDDKRLTASG
jgi:hypothetical protein